MLRATVVTFSHDLGRCLFFGVMAGVLHVSHHDKLLFFVEYLACLFVFPLFTPMSEPVYLSPCWHHLFSEFFDYLRCHCFVINAFHELLF